jgi:hypothetical protein
MHNFLVRLYDTTTSEAKIVYCKSVEELTNFLKNLDYDKYELIDDIRLLNDPIDMDLKQYCKPTGLELGKGD